MHFQTIFSLSLSLSFGPPFSFSPTLTQQASSRKFCNFIQQEQSTSDVEGEAIPDQERTRSAGRWGPKARSMERRLMRSRIQVHKRAVEAAARKPWRTKAAATSWRRTRHAGNNAHATWWSRRTGERRRAATALSAAAEVASSSSSPEEDDGLPNLPVYLPKVEARELEDAKNLILPATKSGRDIGLWLFRLLFTGHRHSWRLLPAFALTFGGKFAGIYGAILFKKAVDSVLDTTANAAGIGGLKVAVAFLLGSGLLKALKQELGELAGDKPMHQAAVHLGGSTTGLEELGARRPSGRRQQRVGEAPWGGGRGS